MGVVNRLAMYGPNLGTVIEVEATAVTADRAGESRSQA